MDIQNFYNTKPKQTSDPIWQKADQGERYHSLLRLYKAPQGYLLKIDCEGKGSFKLSPEGIGIYWEQGGTGPAHYFQTLGLSLWLELQGIPCIHANGLALKDKAIGIIAPSQTGKTTLTAALLESGFQMMSDDMMALHSRADQWMVYPGWPQFRMWPDTAKHYAGDDINGFERVHSRFDKRVVDLETNKKFEFCEQSRPLKHLVLLDRRETETGDIEVDNMPPGEALLHLLQNSMLGDAYPALGIEQTRLQRLANLLEGVALNRISYPTGLSHLPRVCERIKEISN